MLDGDVRNDNDDTHICDDGGLETDWNFARWSNWYCNWLSEYDGGSCDCDWDWAIERTTFVDGPLLDWRDVVPVIACAGNNADELDDDVDEDDDDDDDDAVDSAEDIDKLFL